MCEACGILWMLTPNGPKASLLTFRLALLGHKSSTRTFSSLLLLNRQPRSFFFTNHRCICVRMSTAVCAAPAGVAITKLATVNSHIFIRDKLMAYLADPYCALSSVLVYPWAALPLPIFATIS